jgi:3-hydroxybutyryl-CoA dehydrogenase
MRRRRGVSELEQRLLAPASMPEEDRGPHPDPEAIAIIGGGTMGCGIAYAAARRGLSATIVEPDPAQRAAALARVESDLRRDLDRGLITPYEMAAALEIVSVSASIGRAGRYELVIEAVPEDLATKREVLALAEEAGARRLASNTSSISIDEIAEGLVSPERLIGMHFFNPVRQMALVEIVVGERSAADLLTYAQAFVARLDKEPLVVRDTPGFCTSRLGLALGLEAIRMLESGVAGAEEIDRAMVLGYGHPMGPLRLTDLVGLDVRLDIARVLERAYGERFSPPQLLVDLVDAGHLGRKAGRGFFEWPEVDQAARRGGGPTGIRPLRGRNRG